MFIEQSMDSEQPEIQITNGHSTQNVDDGAHHQPADDPVKTKIFFVVVQSNKKLDVFFFFLVEFR